MRGNIFFLSKFILIAKEGTEKCGYVAGSRESCVRFLSTLIFNLSSLKCSMELVLQIKVTFVILLISFISFMNCAFPVLKAPKQHTRIFIFCVGILVMLLLLLLKIRWKSVLSTNTCRLSEKSSVADRSIGYYLWMWKSVQGLWNLETRLFSVSRWRYVKEVPVSNLCKNRSIVKVSPVSLHFAGRWWDGTLSRSRPLRQWAFYVYIYIL